METSLFMIGVIFLVLAYIVGVRKNTSLLAGYNEKRVNDKAKLANIAGATYALAGIIVLISGALGIEQTEFVILAAVGIIVAGVVYVNVVMVGK